MRYRQMAMDPEQRLGSYFSHGPISVEGNKMDIIAVK